MFGPRHFVFGLRLIDLNIPVPQTFSSLNGAFKTSYRAMISMSSLYLAHLLATQLVTDQ